jgi:hypothetical protein
MKVSEFADKTQVSITKARRYAKELLPPDPEATRQSGKAREINENEGFIIWLGFHLVNRLGFSMIETKAIIKDLRPWMESKGLLPNMKFNPDPPAKDYDILIMRAGTPSGFYYTVKGLIQKKSIKIEGQSAIQEQYTESTAMDPPLQGMLFVDELTASTFKISSLLKWFIVAMRGVEALKQF